MSVVRNSDTVKSRYLSDTVKSKAQNNKLIRGINRDLLESV